MSTNETNEELRQRIEKLLAEPTEPAWKWPLLVGVPAMVAGFLCVYLFG